MIHPITVHFPIVLAFLWPLVDLAGFLFKRPEISRVGLVLLVLTGISSLVSVVSGQAAFDAAVAAKIDPALLNTHADNANLVPWAMLILVVVRTAGVLKLGKRAHLFAIVLGVAAWWLFYVVGGSGGALVFEHGVGVAVEQRDTKR